MQESESGMGAEGEGEREIGGASVWGPGVVSSAEVCRDMASVEFCVRRQKEEVSPKYKRGGRCWV